MTTIRGRLASLIAFALAVLAFACGGDGVVLPNESRPAVITKVSGDSQSAAAGQALELPIVVQVGDALGRPVEGQVVAFTVGAGGGQVAPGTVNTGPDGKASAAWTLGGSAGQQKLRATVTGNGAPDGLLVDFSATAVSGAGANIVLVSGDNQTAAVRSALPESLVVRVSDVLDNPVPGVEVTWDVGGGGSISPVSVTTDANGLAAAQRVLGNASGTQTASASSTGLTTLTFTHTAVAANPTALILISGDAQTGQAGAPLTDPLVVRLVDDNGNGVGNKAITWVVAPGSGSVNPQNVTTSPTGLAQTSWTLGNSAQSNQVSAVFSGLVVPFTATATAGAATKLVFSQVPVNTSAGSPITPAVKVAIQDATGNTVTSASDAITIAIGNNPAGGTLSGTLTVGAVNGVATFSGLSIDKSGNGYTLTASATNGLTGTTSPSFDIVPGAANRLVFLTGPANRVVGEKFSPAIQVQVQDAGGNPVLIAPQITITSSVAGTLTGTAKVTPVLGTATFNNLAITAAGTAYTLTAFASGVSSITSDEFDVAKGSTTIAITSPASGGTSVFGQVVTFGYDINPVSPAVGSLTGTVTISDGSDTKTCTIPAGSGIGTCQIQFATTGSRNVTAVYNGDQNFEGSTSPSVSHTVNQAVTQLTITSDTPEPSQPGDAVTVRWTLQVTGGGAGTPTGTVTVSGGGGVTPCSVTVAFGSSSCSLTFPTGGSKTITVTYPGDANFAGSSDNEPHSVNVPPTATEDAYSVLEDGTLTANQANGVLKNDDDPDHQPQGLVARNFSTPLHGNLTSNSNGSFSYTPDPDFNGTDTFTYEAFDGAAAVQATVTITITAVNDAPSFTSGGDVIVTGDTTFSQGWATNGSQGPADESGQTLTYDVSFDPDFPLSEFLFSVAPSIASDGTLSFTTNGFIGVAHMIVHVQDNGGTANGGEDTSADQTFTITVN